jgi:hypothetical protein
VTGGWSKLHNEEVHNSYSSPGVIRVRKSKKRDAYRILTIKPKRKRPLGWPRHTWRIILKLILKK